MRKTRLVLIPGVKSLDTIGCLLLFLACPAIAFKGQENREVDAICKAQNLKELWVDSPWPGDTDKIGWVRGYGGGTWPGHSQKQNTCNGLSTRSVVRSRISDDRRVQERREASRDDGFETRKIRLEYEIRRNARREMVGRRIDSLRNIRDSRRVADPLVSDEERRMVARRVCENRADSRASTRSFDREIRSARDVRESDSRRDSFTRDRIDIRMRTAEQPTTTTREVIDGRRNSRASTRNFDREIFRSKREVRESDNRRAVLSRERTDATMPAEQQTVRNREVIDERRDSRLSIRSQDTRTGRQIRNPESRRASHSLGRASSRVSDERVRSAERQNMDNRRTDERTNSRLTTHSPEREIRSERDIRQHVSRQDSRFPDRANQRMRGERIRAAERRVMITRDVVDPRTDSAFPVRSLDRTFRSERDMRTLESKRTVLTRERTSSSDTDERRSVDRQNFDRRRAFDDRRDSRFHNQHRDVIRSNRDVRELESQSQNRMVFNERITAAERRTISTREVIDGRRLPSRSLDREMRYKREVRETEGRRASRFQRNSSNMRLNKENRIENRRVLEDRRDSRLSTRSLDRQIRSEREAQEVEHNQERVSMRTDNSRSADERRVDSRMERKNIRESRQTVERRNSRESTQTHRERRAAMDTREPIKPADIRSEGQRRTDDQRERDSRISRSLENIRSTDRRRVDHRRLIAERRDSRLTIRTLERETRSEMEISDRRAARDARESRLLAPADRRFNDIHRADSRQQSRLARENQLLSRSDNSNREAGVTTRRAEVGQKVRIVERASPERVARRVVDVEGVRLVRDESRSPVRLQQSSRSAEDVRQYDSQVRLADTGRETRGYVREVEREHSHGGRNLDRVARGADERQNELRQVRDQYIKSRRMSRLSRSSGDIRQTERQIRLTRAKRETRRIDMHRTEGERESRLIETANPESNSRRVAEAERASTNLVRDHARGHVLTSRMQREVRSVGEIRGSDRLTRRADNRRESRIVDNRHNEIDRDTKTTARASPQRMSRLAADAGLADTSRARDHTRTQTRLLREARSLGDVRGFDRRMPSTETRRETTRSDSRRREVENLPRNLDRISPERINRPLAGSERAERMTRDDSRSQNLSHEREIRSADRRRAVTERESRRLDRREVNNENIQRRLVSADLRRINNRDFRDAEIRRISKDVSLKFESIRNSPNDPRRSDRQRRVEVESYVSRIVDKRRDNTLNIDSVRTFAEHTEPTNNPRRVADIRERYAVKTNAVEREYGQELSSKVQNNFFESSKNALASWLTTDISRTDLNGIAETLMYGGIACFALFSNVNKKVIF